MDKLTECFSSRNLQRQKTQRTFLLRECFSSRKTHLRKQNIDLLTEKSSSRNVQQQKHENTILMKGVFSGFLKPGKLRNLRTQAMVFLP